MRAERNCKAALLAFLLAAPALLPTETSAITAEVAKKCNALLAKEFPPRQVGNPAAGSSKGTAQDQRDYFKKCVENGGKMDSAPDKTSK
jgi:hypothetical protein